jgi:nucleotide-binding universal stress UspA family protein
VKTNKILFPTDFSTPSDAAFAHAVTLARANKATLVVLHVVEPPAAYGAGEMYYGVPDPDTHQLERMLADIVPNDKSIPCEHRLFIGEPAEVILRFARDEAVDMIVMSTHGRTGLSRVLMGSVAEAVVRRAACPVSTVKSLSAPAPIKQPASLTK